MWQPNDDFPFTPLNLDPVQPTFPVPTDDPAFNAIYHYLRDFPTTEFELPSTSSSPGVATSGVDHYQGSSTINPADIIPISTGSRTPSQERSEQIQSDGPKSGKIRIKTHPRSKFRPRTEKESKDSSHYIRSAKNIRPGYPSIYLEESWKNQNNIIEVALVDKDKQPHPYTVDNKERKTSPLIFKENEANSLYFHITESDYEKEEKIFLLEYVKPKQDDYITKELIKARELHQSMLRFTRFYQLPDGSYQRDESSVEYSCLMTEDYGDFTVEDIFPLYGPMCGNQKVCIEAKGHLPTDLKTDLIITLTDNQTNSSYQIGNINKKGNSLTFSMPPYPYPRPALAKVTISIQYKEDTIYETSYLYTQNLDELLAPIVPVSNTGCTLPLYSSTEIRSTKRARQ